MASTPAANPTPPAWLRSYKAQSAHLPNFASQVRTELDNNKPLSKAAPPEPLLSGKPTLENHANDETTTTNQFAFPSTISLTLHNVGTLDKSYSNSTPDSSPKKASFDPRMEQHPVFRQSKGPDQPFHTRSHEDEPEQKRRGTICRLLASIRRAFVSKTQHKLSH
ncbi:MAG: hypothetical protein Q9169_006656 [Polycauliona sp. 2 TL-2023]